MKSLHFLSHSYDETLAIAVKFAKVLKKGDIVCLFGDLGAGKTAFVKGLAKGLEMKRAHVHSPTFTLMNIYDGRLPLYHFDLYRVTANDLFNIGYEEFFYGEGVSAIEWSERLEELTPEFFWKIDLKHAGDARRDIRLSFFGKDAQMRMVKLETILK